MQAVATDAPDTVPAELHLWIVELELSETRRVCHTWTGYATNSIEASYHAKLDFFDRFTAAAAETIAESELLPLVRVRGCAQVGV